MENNDIKSNQSENCLPQVLVNLLSKVSTSRSLGFKIWVNGKNFEIISLNAMPNYTLRDCRTRTAIAKAKFLTNCFPSFLNAKPFCERDVRPPAETTRTRAYLHECEGIPSPGITPLRMCPPHAIALLLLPALRGRDTSFANAKRKILLLPLLHDR